LGNQNERVKGEKMKKIVGFLKNINYLILVFK